MAIVSNASILILTACQVLSALFENIHSEVQKKISLAQQQLLLFLQWVPEVKSHHSVRIRMLHKGNPPGFCLCTVILRKYPAIWWPRKVLNIKVAGSWFNLCNTFLDMVFKHFGNENVHNGLAWTPYSLSRLSSWAFPSGLAKFQKQTLYVHVPVSLLTFAVMTSDSLSCFRFFKICSSREMLTSPFFVLCAYPQKRH